MTNIKNVDEYIAAYPAEVQETLQELRAIIRKEAPEALEVISYQMPAYKLNGMLLYFAVHKNHIGFYPGASAIEAFKNEITEYKWAKGTVQFPFEKPFPFKLAEKIIRFKVKVNRAKIKKK